MPSLYPISVRDELWACLEGCTDSGRTSLELPRLLGGCFVRYIRPAAFSAMRSVETARIHGGIESVPAGAFSGCLSLRELTVEEGVRSLGVMAFSFCMALQDVTLPASLTYIPDNAFPEGCSAVFRVPKESEAERYCLEKGFKVAYTE